MPECAQAHAPHRILVDDESMRSLFVLLLKDAECEVRVAEQGQRALEILRSWPPCVVLLDRTMPVMDGLTFVTRLRDEERAREIPVVLMTAGRDSKTLMTGFALSEVLQKPFDLDELLALVARLAR
jgi:CheY-like chemotaxis protein